MAGSAGGADRPIDSSRSDGFSCREKGRLAVERPQSYRLLPAAGTESLSAVFHHRFDRE